ncbi:hypothetical protein A2645_01915 [Candidatus Nomurabacteria bacterium RIFCSPHIGHO2_01_FULL_39_9]|uniref:Large ribosomal subunit protein bL25 n=1 Tax=Candidatus Nomurabacteria bacterium RIFCSPHIGHO2_01_FULL_39_9 TaxID=1801735 RepID=A0A1F6UX01_9BACT|nr:MAG: hypothetical protein A2645_01915 [Candidatus Nomurabacteria bacterium RIFCSPHIGHO2_01_FULL_39_9]
MTVLEAQKRKAGAKLGSLRKEGQIPAVIYGAGKESTPVSVLGTAFIKIHKGGETTPISLKTPEGVVDAMIQDIAYDPITSSPIHVDFLAIDVNKEIEAKIPLEFIGEAPATKGGLGALVKVMHEIEVLALPKNLPHHIEVPLEKLATLEDHIFVSDLKIPAGVKAITAADEVIASIAAIKEEVEAPAGPVDLSTIEVVKKGKKEEEGEGEVATAA